MATTKPTAPTNEAQAIATFGEWLKSQLSLMTDDTTLQRGMQRKDKSFDECAQWIYDGVKKSGCMGCHTPNEEIIGMAIHYFTEDDVKKADLSLASVSHYVKSASTPKAEAPKAAPVSEASASPTKKATIPTKASAPTKKASIPTKAPAPTAPQVLDLDDDFDVD